MKTKFINVKTKDFNGKRVTETLEEINSSDFDDERSFLNHVAQKRGSYAMQTRGHVYVSSRSSKNWTGN